MFLSARYLEYKSSTSVIRDGFLRVGVGGMVWTNRLFGYGVFVVGIVPSLLLILWVLAML
jgi:hypothetical protein